MNNFTGAFDNLARQFYNETGVVAPGKDIPPEMGSVSEYELRVKLWDMWRKQNELLLDKERLDWLQSKGGNWIARDSSTGRGFRVHQDASLANTTDNIRVAIDVAITNSDEY